MKRFLLGCVAVALVAGGLLWLRERHFSEAARIRRTLRGLLEDLSFPAGTGNLAKAARFNRILGRFAPDVTISVEQVVPMAPPLTGRDELHGALQATFSQLGQCTVTLHDLVVAPVPRGSRDATAAFTASLSTQRPGVEFSAQEFEVHLRRDGEGSWLLDRITAVRTLQR